MTWRPGNAAGPARYTRRRSDVVLLVVSGALLALTALPVRPDSVPGLEVDVFRLVNDTIVVPFTLVWLVMQLGNVAVVPLAALVAAAFRRFRLAASILGAGLLTYVLAKLVKRLVERGRPTDLLPDVNVRGDPAGGLGYVSGHAASVALIAAVAFPYLGRWGRVAVCTLAGLVCLARVYVSAHLPLDVVGGVALGLLVSAVMHLLFGSPTRPVLLVDHGDDAAADGGIGGRPADDVREAEKG
jgi:undecaprenyl-diphosphatase